ncbi:MAG: hypothetical protein WBZ29_14725 [Methanocella sp.]
MAKVKTKAKNPANAGTGTKAQARGDTGRKPAIRRAPSFFKVYVTNVLPVATREDFRVELFNERFKVGEGWVYRSEGSMILTRAAAKKLAVELTKKVEAYEAEHGEIKAADELGPISYFD